ncbi:Pr6Pr family membrane protein [Microbacterium candidum]|uniref:Pr6Pr family membrane protein n=1 Tax=Microbacterium candidum TaxID=3041922 RepID=A0ABT7N1H8_9MICO|nr:Pr6Pr family membrane protein [Microbacterium sp. ASV49]MDL9980521.1 Pr6Pr family membrane protein [Microbacterium sp. ASV49]
MSWSSWRIVAASIAITGVVAGGVVDVARGFRLGEDMGLVVADYFSYFTVVSVISTIVVLFIAARPHGPLATPDGMESPALAVALATTSTAMIILSIVYNTMLRGLPLVLATPDPAWVAFLDRWSEETMHVVLPAYLVIDVLFAPRRRRLTWRALIGIVGIPLGWALYTMVRGPLVDAPDGSTRYWYPYPFLDPNGPEGYQTPLIYIGVIAAAFLILGSVMVLLTHRHRSVPRADRADRAVVARARPRAHV